MYCFMCTCYAAHQGPLIGIINILILILILINKIIMVIKGFGKNRISI